MYMDVLTNSLSYPKKSLGAKAIKKKYPQLSFVNQLDQSTQLIGYQIEDDLEAFKFGYEAKMEAFNKKEL